MKRKMSRIRDMLAGGLAAVLVMGLAVPVMAAQGSQTAKLVYDNIKLVINGETVTPRDGKGNVVEPFTIDGTTYLPVRAVARALDMDVDWNGKTKTVTLTGNTGSSGAVTPPDHDASDYIGVEKAKSIALKHAGVKASDATFFTAKLDWDDGRAEYEIEFYSGSTEYDYDIDALTGEIRSWDHEADGYSIPGGTDSKNYISLEKAKSLALKKAPNGAVLTSIELDHDDGRAIYEGELKKDRTEYEFEIDAVTGDFLKWEADYDD